jgi:hypothetical protein
MARYLRLSLAVGLLLLAPYSLAQSAGAQIDTVFIPSGDVWPSVGGSNPNYTIYGPGAFELPNGNLGIYA